MDGLLSDSNLKRIEAEAKQAAAEGAAAARSRELEETRKELAQAREQAKAEAAANLETANKYRVEQLWKWGSLAFNALLGLAVIAYKLNIGRLQQGAAEVIAGLQAKHGDEAASAARSILDGVLHTGEQKGVAKAFFNLTKQ